MKLENFFKPRHFDTYRIAEIANRITSDHFTYIRQLSELLGDESTAEYAAPFRKRSALHIFLSNLIEYLFSSDVDTPVTLVPSGVQKFSSTHTFEEAVWVLPVEVAFEEHNIDHITFRQFREERGLKELEPNFHREKLSTELADEYDEYYSELTLSEVNYEILLDTMANDAFFVLFNNRDFLYNFNYMMSTFVQFIEEGELENGGIALQGKDGNSRLKRASPPQWARRSIEFRDRCRCTFCLADLSPIHTPINEANFDHIIPLDKGGLNDVSNLQLLCIECNNKKSSKMARPGEYYQRWYPE
ncbi:HNH endonuclease [Nocardiopsis sp. M1B1]|uniref:HNH endonuclease n=1 Tax=Nocardiopsis sp. M1B1 TaxID=3450454 RepID=UPI00403A1FA4